MTIVPDELSPWLLDKLSGASLLDSVLSEFLDVKSLEVVVESLGSVIAFLSVEDVILLVELFDDLESEPEVGDEIT